MTSRRGGRPANARKRRPLHTLRTTFAVTDAVIAAVGKALESTQIPRDEAGMQSALFDVALAVRAQNALKVTRLLCRESHWEFAVSAVRQIFELVLTAEYIAGQEDRQTALMRYQRFGLLQLARREAASAAYNRDTGRVVEEERLRVIERLLARSFDEFKVPRKKGWVWATTWCRLTTKQLADKSLSSIRPHQYEQLFSDWSDQTHAAPAALLDTMFPGARDLDTTIESDDVRIAETLASAVTFVLELWTLLPSMPPSDPKTAYEWMTSLLEEAIRLGGVPMATPHTQPPEANQD